MGIAMTCRTSGERRLSPRKSSAECGWLVAARLRPGRVIKLLDLSNGGALVEATARLLPGAPIVLHLVGVGGAHTIQGTVLRCYVAALDPCSGVRYRAALAFNHSFRFPEANPVERPLGADCPMSAAEADASRRERVADTRAPGRPIR